MLLFFYCTHNVLTDCKFAKWLYTFMIGYAVTLLILFLNFYIKTYLLKNNSKQNKTSIQNGSKKTN